MEKLLLVDEQKHYMQRWGIVKVFSPHLLRTEINYMSNKFEEVRLLQILVWFFLFVLQENIVNHNNWASLVLDT